MGWILLEVIHAVSAIILRQHSQELGVSGFSLASLFQADLGILVVNLVDEEAASVLQKMKRELGAKTSC